MTCRTEQPRFLSRLTCLFLVVLFLALSMPQVLPAAGDNQRMALVMKSLGNPFFSKMAQGAKEYAAHKKIDLDIFGTERETDVEQQIAIIENIIAQKYLALILAPVHSQKLIPVCKKAIESGIDIITIDTPLDREKLRELKLEIPFVGADNRVGAGMVGRYIRTRLQGQGRVFIIEGIRGVDNAEQRRKGFIDELTNNTDIKVVASESANWHTDEAFSLTTRLLAQHGQVDAILCANDGMALGALRALELQGLEGRILIGSYDNIETVRAAMRSGFIHATVEQHPELMGEYGVRLAADSLNGKDIPRYSTVPFDLVTYEGFGRTLGLSISSLDNPFFKILVDGAKNAAELFGAKLIVADAEDRDDKQLSDILGFIDQGVSGIIVNPTNADTIVPGIELANSQGIPVFAVDRKVSTGEIVTLVTSDNVAGGELAARLLNRYLQGQGRIVELEGMPGASATVDRGTGFNNALKEYPGLKIVARESARFERERAKSVLAGIMARVDFDAVFAHNDNMILGALDALNWAGVRDKVLIGFDGIPAALEAVEADRINATIAQIPGQMGRVVVTRAVEYLRGEAVPQMVLVELDAIEQAD